MKLLACFGLLLAASSTSALAQAAPLTVNVSNFKNIKGMARYWLWRSPDGFPTGEKKALKIVEAPIVGTASHYTFESLPAGTYAVVVSHDENSHHKFDTSVLGVPAVAYGVTNGARGGISGPPKFAKASFAHGKDGTAVAVQVE